MKNIDGFISFSSFMIHWMQARKKSAQEDAPVRIK